MSIVYRPNHISIDCEKKFKTNSTPLLSFSVLSKRNCTSNDDKHHQKATRLDKSVIRVKWLTSDDSGQAIEIIYKPATELPGASSPFRIHILLRHSLQCYLRCDWLLEVNTRHVHLTMRPWHCGSCVFYARARVLYSKYGARVGRHQKGKFCVVFLNSLTR